MIDDYASFFAALHTLPGLSALGCVTAAALALTLFGVGLMRDWPPNPPRLRDRIKARRAHAQPERQP